MGTSCYSDKNAILSNQAGRVLTLPGIKVYPHHVLLRTCRIWVSYLKGYSTKQNPQAVFLTLSSPMMMRLTSPLLENSSWTCSTVTKIKRQKWGLCDCWSQRGLLGHLIRITGHEKMEKQAKKKKKKENKNIIRIIWSPKRWKWSYLLLGGVEGEIANIQSVALLQQLLLFITVSLKTHNTM